MICLITTQRADLLFPSCLAQHLFFQWFFSSGSQIGNTTPPASALLSANPGCLSLFLRLRVHVAVSSVSQTPCWPKSFLAAQNVGTAPGMIRYTSSGLFPWVDCWHECLNSAAASTLVRLRTPYFKARNNTEASCDWRKAGVRPYASRPKALRPEVSKIMTRFLNE